MSVSVLRLANWSIRARVITAVVGLTGVALALSGLIVVNRGHALTEQRVAADLQLAVDEFANLAVDGLDPSTGSPFTEAETLLRVAVQRSVLATTEGVFGVVGDRVRWTAQEGVVFRPEDDPEFTAHVLPLTGRTTVSQGRVTTAVRDYRYVVVPVMFANQSPTGALVRAVDFAAEESLLGRGLAQLRAGRDRLADAGRAADLVTGGTPARAAGLDAPHRRGDHRHRPVPPHPGPRQPTTCPPSATTINGMLDRLEVAVGAQRRAAGRRRPRAADPGDDHPRAPGADGREDPDDVARPGRCRSTRLDRMGRLVDDLLTLAKAERLDFLQRQPTDVGRLTDETLERATAAWVTGTGCWTSWPTSRPSSTRSG